MNIELKKIVNIQNRSKLSVGERIIYLNKLKKEIIQNEDNIFSALHKDLNKPKFEVYTSEIGFLLNEIELFIKHLKEWSKPKKVKSSIINFPSNDFIYSEPYGKVLIISPWNYPFQLAILPVLSAFSCGNTVVLKPSEHTPETSKLVNKIISKIFPSNLVCVVEGDYKAASKLLKSKWDYIFFTGSVRVGKIVAEEAAKQLTPHTLELGGKSPSIVYPDVDEDWTVDGIIGAMRFTRQSQSCTAGSRLFLHKKIFDSFIGKLSEKLDKLIIGNPLDDDTDIGTIINNKQFTKVCDYISEGLNNKNTEVICGGLPPEDGPLSEGYYTIPTIFRNKSNEWRLAKEEIFGPVLVAIPWDDEEEVIRMANQSHYGLAAYVWTRDITRGINAAHAIESGWVQVNQGLAQAPGHSYGGFKQSGIGR